MISFTQAVEKLKVVLETSKTNEVASNRALYHSLSSLLAAIPHTTASELGATASLNVLEDLFNHRNIQLTKGLQTLVNSVYVALLSATPGYVVRNVVTNLISICSNKAQSIMSKECVTLIIGNVMERRAADLGSLINDVIACMTKMTKNSEVVLKVGALLALKNLICGAGALVADCHVEIIKTVSRLTDKCVEVRCAIAKLVTEIASQSNGCTTVSSESFLAIAIKGLEDESAIVQETFAFTVATVYNELIRFYQSEQEKLKVGAARGGASESDKPDAPSKDSNRRGSLMKFKELSSVKDILSSTLNKKAVDEHDFKSVVKSIVKTTVKASNSFVKAGYIVSLQYLIQMNISAMDVGDIEWLAGCIFSSLSDNAISALPYEELVYFRSRLSHLFRSAVSSQLNESTQIELVSFICLYLSGLESNATRTEHELQLGFSELGQLIAALGAASAVFVDKVRSVASTHLRHSSFGVRASAAHVLVGLAIVVPALASDYFRDALSHARDQVSMLLKSSGPGRDGRSDSNIFSQQQDAESPGEIMLDVTISAGGAAESPLADGGIHPAPPRKSSKDTERLRTMFNFHGQILLISIFLKYEKSISTGLPKRFVLDSFDFGLDMLTLDVFAADPTMRHVVCSVIRAGSLILSSCLNMGYSVVSSRISKLLSSCSNILFATTTSQHFGEASNDTAAPGGGSQTTALTTSLLYELMSVEAALVCISALLWFCPEALVFNEHYLDLVVDGLDIAFQVIKGKYQARFRSHFRFRTLHVILLECFSWLPPGSFPSTCQQLFVEGLRVFRDSISNGFECTGFLKSVPPGHRILTMSNTSRPNCDNAFSENLVMLRLEYHSTALQKKESEAFLASFARDPVDYSRPSLYCEDWCEPTSPCAFIDSRTVDSAISLVAATFSSQSDEFQDKAIELCTQILAQVQKSTNSIGMFTSDEEKRRRDRHASLSTRNTVTLLHHIIESYPHDNNFASISSTHPRNWISGLSERLFELLTSTNSDIRSSVANSLCSLCSKSVGSHLVEAVAIKIIQAIKSCTDKKSDGSADSACGYIIALSCLWDITDDKPTLQAAMSTIIFDTLKRFEYSSLLRGCTIFALSNIVKSKAVGQGSHDVQQTLSLLAHACDAAEGHLLSSNTASEASLLTGDNEILLVCLQRLVNATVSILMAIDPSSSLMRRAFLLWTTIRESSSQIYVERECIEFIVSASMFPTEELNETVAAHFLQKVLNKRSGTNLETLQAAVAAVRALVIRNSKVVCDVGIDIDLFKLLDWCVSCVMSQCAPPYWGIELHNGLNGVMETTLSLQRAVESTLDAVVGIDVQQRPDLSAVRWLLTCRAIALGIGGTAAKTEIDVTVAEVEESNGLGKAGPIQGESRSSMTYQQFVMLKRDEATSKASSLVSSRTRIRCVALRCAIAAFMGASHNGAHSDLHVSRAETQMNLGKLGSLPSTKALEDVPCYLSLFLQDIINVACACAAYTIDDHRQTALQSEAVDLLNAVVAFFWDTTDPDALASKDATLSNSNSCKLLEIYIAQIVSALRPCLSAQWCPALLLTTGGLVCDLIRGEFLRDKTVIRRFLKSFLANGDVENDTFKVRPPMSDLVAEEVSTVSFVANMTNLARVYILGMECDVFRGVSKDIKSTIVSTMTPHLRIMQEVWRGIEIDGARLLQGHRKWVKASAETDCRRGGLTYSPIVETQKIIIYYEYAMPFVAAATSMVRISPEIEESELPPIFLHILEGLLEKVTTHSGSHVDHRLALRGTVGHGHSGSVIQTSRVLTEPLMYASLSRFASRFDVRSDCDEWTRIVFFIAKDVIPHRSSIQSPSDFCSLLLEITSVLKSLTQNIKFELENIESNQREWANSIADLWVWQWISSLSLLALLFSDIFEFCDGNSSFVSTIQGYYSRRPEDSGQSSEFPFHALFPIIKGAPDAPTTALAAGRIEHAIRAGVLNELLTLISSLTLLCDKSDECVSFSSGLLISVLCRVGFVVGECMPREIEGLSGLVSVLLCRLLNSDTGNSAAVVSANRMSPNKLLLAWLKFFSHDESDKQTLASIKGVLDPLVFSWLTNKSFEFSTGSCDMVAVLLADMVSVPESRIATRGTLTAVQINLYVLLNKYLSKIPVDKLNIIISNVFPSALFRFGSLELAQNTELSLAILEFMFAVLNKATAPDLRSALLLALLTALCSGMKAISDDSVLLTFCGSQMTLLAKSDPDTFKAQVLFLSPDHRVLLQAMMRSAIVQQQASSTTLSVPGNITGKRSTEAEKSIAKKIDLSRYKK